MDLNRARNIYLILIFTFLARTAAGQAEQDVVIPLSGKIMNAVDSSAVEAKITLESLPDNAEVHIIESSETNGIFSVILHKKTSYSILVDAPYYKPEMDTLTAEDLGKFDLLYLLLPVKLGQVLQLQKIYFPQGGATILESSYGELAELKYLLDEYPDMVVRLEGHTDRLGGRKSNMILSEKRVESIRTYLIKQGISGKRIKLKAFGGTRPVSTENTEAAHRANRRVEVRILKI